MGPGLLGLDRLWRRRAAGEEVLRPAALLPPWMRRRLDDRDVERLQLGRCHRSGRSGCWVNATGAWPGVGGTGFRRPVLVGASWLVLGRLPGRAGRTSLSLPSGRSGCRWPGDRQGGDQGAPGASSPSIDSSHSPGHWSASPGRWRPTSVGRLAGPARSEVGWAVLVGWGSRWAQRVLGRRGGALAVCLPLVAGSCTPTPHWPVTREGAGVAGVGGCWAGRPWTDGGGAWVVRWSRGLGRRGVSGGRWEGGGGGCRGKVGEGSSTAWG